MSFNSSRRQRSAGVPGEPGLLVGIYLFEAAALVTALALNRYYNLLGSLTTRQAAVLWVPLAICLASGAYVALRFQRARSSGPRPLAFAIAMNLVAVMLVLVGSELAVRAFSESTFAGVSFSGTLLLPKDWEDVKARLRGGGR